MRFSEIDMTKLDVKKIKSEINMVAAALREYRARFKQSQRENGGGAGRICPSEETIAKDPDFWKHYDGGRGWWRWSWLETDYTRLCALRAHMRGKLHFCPRTKEETAGDLGILWPITQEAQADWVEEIAEGYKLSEEPGKTAA